MRVGGGGEITLEQQGGCHSHLVAAQNSVSQIRGRLGQRDQSTAPWPHCPVASSLEDTGTVSDEPGGQETGGITHCFHP